MLVALEGVTQGRRGLRFLEALGGATLGMFDVNYNEVKSSVKKKQSKNNFFNRGHRAMC